LISRSQLLAAADRGEARLAEINASLAAAARPRHSPRSLPPPSAQAARDTLDGARKRQ